MLKKTIFFISIIFFIFSFDSLFANSQGYRDELPELQRLTDLSIGIRRINKGLKYEAKGKIKKANKMYNEAIDFLPKLIRSRYWSWYIFLFRFAYNRLNKIYEAETYYILGLTLEPNNQYINKYLGELYLTLNKVNLAKERLKAINDCECKEYTELKIL